MRFTLRIGTLATAIMCLCATAFGFPQQPAQPSREQPQKVEIPATAATLEGVPTVKIESSQGQTTRQVLSAAEAAKDRLVIKAVNGQYYWASRDNLVLNLSSSGDFTYLSSSEPGRYIRFTKVNDKIQYVEHLDVGVSGNPPRGSFGSVTWFGELRIVLQK
jgi:hypothetical protein